MDEKKLKALAAELAKGLKTEADLNQFSRMLTKLTVETPSMPNSLTISVMRKMPLNQALIPETVTRPKPCYATRVRLNSARHATVKIPLSRN
jgi:putative transposase